MWDLLVSIPDHCLSFYFIIITGSRDLPVLQWVARSSPCGSWCQVFVCWYVGETMYYLEENNELVFGHSCLQCFPFKMVQHRCHPTSVLVSISDIPGNSSLDHLSLLYIVPGVGIPYSGWCGTRSKAFEKSSMMRSCWCFLSSPAISS